MKRKSSKSLSPLNWPGETLAFMLLRVWIAMRAFVSGLEKFAGVETREEIRINEFTEIEETVEVSFKTYGLDHYHAIPDSLKSQFASEPLLPELLSAPYYATLGYILIILGIMIGLGIYTRLSLFVMGLVYTSLTFGMILLNEAGGIAWLAIHVAIVAAALILVKNNRLTLTRA